MADQDQAVKAAQEAATKAAEAAALAQRAASEKELEFFQSCRTIADLKKPALTPFEGSRICSRYISRLGLPAFQDLMRNSRP